MLQSLLKRIHLWYWERRYRAGRVITRFLAPDIRREIELVDVSLIDAGLISARIRTWNVLYAVKGLAPELPFGDVRQIAIRELWLWSGEPWGVGRFQNSQWLKLARIAIRVFRGKTDI
jgi:hypothetical protein